LGKAANFEFLNFYEEGVLIQGIVKENLGFIGTKFPHLGTTVKSLHWFDSWMYQGRCSQVKARLISLKLLNG